MPFPKPAQVQMEASLARSLLLAKFKRLPDCEAAEPVSMPLLLT